LPKTRPEGATLVGAAAASLWALLVLGLFFHHSMVPEVFGRFSKAYALGLVLVAIAMPLVFLAARAIATPTTVPRPGAKDIVVRPPVKVSVVAAALLLAFALAQLLPALAERRTGIRFERHPFLQAVPRPNPARGVNSRGFRGPEPAVPKPPETFRILLLGGSTSFDPALDFEDSYGRRLEEFLGPSLAPKRVEVQVAAVPGFNSEHILIRYAADAADLEPDLVLVMEAINDVYACGMRSAPFRRDYGHLSGIDAGTPAALRDRTELLRAAAWYARYVLFSDFRSRPNFDAEEPDSQPFVRNISALVAVARARGQTVVLCTQPHRFRTDLPEADRLRGDAALRNFRNDIPLPGFLWFCRAMAVFNEATRALAAREGLPLLDLDRLVPPRTDLFSDEVHVTPAGALLEAQTAARFLLDRGLAR
jgi:lysophospholipase L1-like esterase